MKSLVSLFYNLKLMRGQENAHAIESEMYI